MKRNQPCSVYLLYHPLISTQPPVPLSFPLVFPHSKPIHISFPSFFNSTTICKIKFIPSFYCPHSHVCSWDYCHDWADISPGSVLQDPRNSLVVHSLFFLSLLISRSIFITWEWPKLFGFYKPELFFFFFSGKSLILCLLRAGWSWQDQKTPQTICLVLPSPLHVSDWTAELQISPSPNYSFFTGCFMKVKTEFSTEKELWCFHKNREMKWWQEDFKIWPTSSVKLSWKHECHKYRHFFPV